MPATHEDISGLIGNSIYGEQVVAIRRGSDGSTVVIVGAMWGDEMASFASGNGLSVIETESENPAYRSFRLR